MKGWELILGIVSVIVIGGIIIQVSVYVHKYGWPKWF
jgi:hypothetical protein